MNESKANVEQVRIFCEAGWWYVQEGDRSYPVRIAIGGYTWALETQNFSVVFEDNFVPYTIRVANHAITSIEDHLGNQLQEFWLSKGGSHIKHFFKLRSHEGKVDRVCIDTPWDRQLYGSEESRQGAQVKYTIGW